MSSATAALERRAKTQDELGRPLASFAAPTLEEVLHQHTVAIVAMTATAVMAVMWHAINPGAVWTLPMALLAMLMLVTFALSHTWWPGHVDAYSLGLRWARPGRATEELLWCDVVGLLVDRVLVRTRAGNAQRDRLVFWTRDGRRIQIDHRRRGFRRLLTIAESATVEPLTMRARAQIHDGHRVPFGTVHLLRNGIEVAGRVVPWCHLQHIIEREGTIYLQFHAWGAHAVGPYGDVPCARAWMRLCGQLAGHSSVVTAKLARDSARSARQR